MVYRESERGTRVTTVETNGGNDQITIVDATTGTRASILTSVGFNCYSFRPVVDGAAVDVIWAEEGFGPRSELSLHGIPLLFPFAGRLRGDSFSYHGRSYRVTGAGSAGGNVFHGFVISRPWRVVEQSDDRGTGEFQASVDDPSLLTQWPADFRIRVTYRVAGTSLLCDVAVDNPDDKPLPFGFGTHPYFRLPLGAGDPEACVITIPAAEVWAHEGALPTGERAAVTDREDFRAGMRFGDLRWDGVLTGLAVADDGLVHATIEDPSSGLVVEQTFPPAYRNAVVWTPPHRGAVAVEPWTTVPNAFELSARGIDTGLIELPPGGRWESRITIAASKR